VQKDGRLRAFTDLDGREIHSRMMTREESLREQHKRRLSWMPWLYFILKPKHQEWALPWQQEIQDFLRASETIEIGRGCFIAPEARLFAEPGRPIVIGDRCAIGADVFVHGPVTLGPEVSLNPRVSIDGGAAGVRIGEGTRIAVGAALYAFDHQISPDRPIREQPVRSRGIVIGSDVWIGANAGVTDGVAIGDHSVVGMGAVVTRDVPPWTIVAGAPARPIGDRRA
jgi:acetyltransferase-like isoleucine patch superfamily enzyme